MALLIKFKPNQGFDFILQNIQNVYGEKRDPLFFLPIPLLYCSWKKVGFFAIRQNVDIKGS